MDLAAFILGALVIAMLLAVAGLVLLLRAALREAEPFEDIEHGVHDKSRGFFGFFARMAWWRRDETVRLFYQRDAKGRFRKIRRH